MGVGSCPRQHVIACPLSDYHPILHPSMSLNSIEKLCYTLRFRIKCEERL